VRKEKRPYLGREGEVEYNVEQDEEDKGCQLFPKLMIVLSMGKFVGVLRKNKNIHKVYMDTN
jgi:hypothetical protein